MNGDAQESELGPPLTTGSLGAWDRSGIEAIVLRVSLIFLVGAMFALVGALRGRVAARAERVRLVRDIHDTVLQDLAAANLMLRSALGLPPETARETLADAGALIADQQRRIRQIARNDGDEPAPQAKLVGDDLAALSAALGHQWRCGVSVDLRPPDCVPAGLAADVSLILREAVANAVQHGHATRIEAVAERTGDTLRLELSDDGHARAGESADGSGAIRPASLAGRVADLGGSMSATRTDAGVVLTLDLPIR
jgi:signal transduction histidine kinase